MGREDKSDYEPSTAKKPPKDESAKNVTVSIYRCPACQHVCRPRDLDPLLERLCPKCFRAAVAKVVPEMDNMNVIVPADPGSAAIEPKPGTTAYVALNRGDEQLIDTERMERQKPTTKHTTYRKDRKTGRTVITTRYRKKTGETTGKTTKAKTKTKTSKRVKKRGT